MMKNHFPASSRLMTAVAIICGLMSVLAQVTAQEKPASTPPIEISKETRSIDPATMVPAALATKLNVKFDGQSLKEFFAWLRQAQPMTVLVDQKELVNGKVLESDPIYDELNDEPLYLLLNRLVSVGLRWYVEEDLLRITTINGYEQRATTVAYNLGDLIDAGYSASSLVQTIAKSISADAGQPELVADVVFIRQTPEIHREISGLLEALRHPVRRTLTYNSPQNEKLHAILEQRVSVDFEETPLIVALEELSKKVQIRLKLDHRYRIRERVPVSLKVNDQKLRTILQSILPGLNLSWASKDGLLYVVRSDSLKYFYKTAVYDVRDLCADDVEAAGLRHAILSSPPVKMEAENSIVIEMPKNGILVVRHKENLLDDILEVLENYRTALRASKERPAKKTDPNEVVTGYYRMPKIMSNGVQRYILKTIQPDSWQSQEHPDRIGTILVFNVEPTALDASGATVTDRVQKSDASAAVIENEVLMIRQTRAVHEQIGKLIQDLTSSTRTDSTAIVGPPPPKTLPFGKNLIQKAGQ